MQMQCGRNYFHWQQLRRESTAFPFPKPSSLERVMHVLSLFPLSHPVSRLFRLCRLRILANQF